MLLGILQITIGGFCGLMALMSVVGVLVLARGHVPGAPPVDPKAMIPGLGMYVAAAVLLIWLGIGSIQARRWAWSLTVVCSWLILINGAFGLIYMACLAPAMRVSIDASMQKANEQIQKTVDQQQKEMQRQAELHHAPPPPRLPRVNIPAGMTKVLLGLMFAFMGGVILLLPAAFLLFYQRASVRATCQRRDGQVRWTDRCPLPVLAVSVLMAFSALCMLWMAVGWPVCPVFGELITGPAGAGLMLVVALAATWLAWASYRLKMAAWWGILVYWIALTVSSMLTFSHPETIEKMYRAMNMPADQLEAFRKAGLYDSMVNMRWPCVVTGVGVLCYLLYLRRYFVRSDAGVGQVANLP
jgi:hypothetical protein